MMAGAAVCWVPGCARSSTWCAWLAAVVAVAVGVATVGVPVAVAAARVGVRDSVARIGVAVGAAGRSIARDQPALR